MGQIASILVVDDEKNIALVVEAMLKKAGFDVVVSHSGSDAIGLLGLKEFDVVLTDLYMPEASGMEVLEFCRENLPGIPVVMMTAFGTIEAAVSALKSGAFDFVTKPFDRDELLSVIRKSVSARVANQREPRAEALMGETESIREILKVIEKVADSPTTVLVTGESGTEKELIANEIHRTSNRSREPFIKLNCASVPSALLESELFGYEKSISAEARKPGKVELANAGTLFIDEVAKMSIEVQTKLLRFLNDQEFERVGGVSSIKGDVRIIAATDRALAEEVKKGSFREDLFYRLSVVPLTLPPLRDRRADIPLFIEFFLEKFKYKLSKPNCSISESCVKKMMSYDWPGNLRQLENVLEGMVLMVEGDQIGLRELPLEVREYGGAKSFDSFNSKDVNFKEIVRKRTQTLERELIEKALLENEWNITHTADRLGLSRKGLQLKIRELGVKRVV